MHLLQVVWSKLTHLMSPISQYRSSTIRLTRMVDLLLRDRGTIGLRQMRTQQPKKSLQSLSLNLESRK